MRIYDGTICLVCLVLKNMVLFTTELDLRRQKSGIIYIFSH